MECSTGAALAISVTVSMEAVGKTQAGLSFELLPKDLLRGMDC